MDPVTIALVALRGLATLFAFQGRTREADALRLVAAGVESGKDVDDHLRLVAQALEGSGGAVSDALWDDVHARIIADSDRLQAR